MSTALVTGASSGIGKIYARRLAARGHDLVLVARDGRRLEELAAELAETHGTATEVIVADLAEQRELDLVAERLRGGGAIDILVNNAGTAVVGGLASVEASKTYNMLQLNVWAPTYLAHAALPAMIARGSGAIVNIASVLALLPEISLGAYAATKSYLLTLSQSLHAEVAEKGIYIQAVLPAVTRTEIYERAGIDLEHLTGIMEAAHLVDGALIGFDRRELVTIPAVHDEAAWDQFEAGRSNLASGFGNAEPAPRYRA